MNRIERRSRIAVPAAVGGLVLLIGLVAAVVGFGPAVVRYLKMKSM